MTKIFLKMAAKGNKIELSTFQKYGKSDIIGYKAEHDNERMFVTFIWCKHKETILADPTLIEWSFALARN